MEARRSCVQSIATGLLVLLGSSVGLAQQSGTLPIAASHAHQTLQAAAQHGKFTFLLFHRGDDAATQAMAQKLNNSVARREEATAAYVNVADPAAKALIEKYGVSRSPLPLTLAVAPNGAITGIFSQKLAPESVDQAIVTPAMMHSMKALQDGKIVLVCVHGSTKPLVPHAVAAFKKDPLYINRTTTVSVSANDPAEARFLTQMKIGASPVQGVTTVVLAPPGVLVDKFDESATSSQIAAALVKAGKCCDDPNCKHNHQHRATQADTRKATR